MKRVHLHFEGSEDLLESISQSPFKILCWKEVEVEEVKDLKRETSLFASLWRAGSHLVNIGLRWSDSNCCRCPTAVDPLALRQELRTHRGSDSRQRPEGILEPYGAVDFGLGARTMSVQSGNGAGLLEVEQKTSRTIGLAPVLILSLSSCPWIKYEHSDGRGQVERSQGIVSWSATERFFEIARGQDP